MLKPPPPPNDGERLAVLRNYGILDTLPEQEYEDITRLAASICGVPVVAISLIDAERQWFKSIVGLDVRETSRDVSFCAHTMLGEDVMVVSDTLQDDRFADNPLVIGGPKIRFYAGTPLVTADHIPLGALCVIDTVPRALKPAEITALQALGRQVMAQLELGRLLREQVELNKRLRLSEAESRKLSIIVTQMTNAVLITCTRGKITWANDAFTRLTGYTLAEVIGKKPDELLQGQGTDRAVVDSISEHLRDRRTFHGELLNYRKDGSAYWFDIEIQAIKDEAGVHTGYICIQKDIHARKLAETALRESEARFRALSTSAPVGIFQTDAEGSCTYTNERWQDIYGLVNDRSLGTAWMSAIHPADQKEIAERWMETAANGLEFDHTFRLLRRGATIHVHAGARPIFNERHELISHIGCVADITAAKEAEHALHEAKAAAEAGNQAKGDFLAMISHEIRTPMNGILGFAEMLQSTPLAPDQRRFADIIRNSGEDLLTIINDVLDTSKIEAGRLNLEQKPFDTREVIVGVIQLLEPRVREKGLLLTLDCPLDLPTGVVADRVRVRQVIINLVNNALKFTEHGEIRVLLQRDPDKALRVTVQDTGDGIPADKQSRLFQKFSQVDSSASRRHGGTGLGLVICRRIVELMGGQIGFDSTPGLGSRFWFTIPERNAPAVAPQIPSAPQPAKQRRGVRVLLAEDNPINQELATLILNRLGCNVTLAADGEEALLRFGEGRYELVLMDCQMPKLDGYAATTEIRLRESGAHRTPIIALTANATEGERERCLAVGMDDFLCKPLHAAELQALLARWCPATG